VGIAKDDGSGLNDNSKVQNTGSLLRGRSPTALNNGDYFISGDNGANIDLRSTDAPSGYGRKAFTGFGGIKQIS